MHTAATGIPRLFEIRNKFGIPIRAEKWEIISFLRTQQRFTKKQFKQYFDTLLFIKAYPDDKSIFELADEEIKRLAALLKNHPRLANSLEDSGIRNTLNRGFFSFTLTKWLRSSYGKNTQLEQITADQKKCISVLTCIMGEVPVEILQEGYMNWEQWLIKFRLNKEQDLLDVLISHFEKAPVTPRIKDELWNDMGLVISIMLDDSTSFIGSGTNIAPSCRYHTLINRNIIIQDVLKKKPREVRINDTKKAELIALAKLTLACQQRETDPVTHATPQYSRYYTHGDGFTILLLGMPPERRQPIDSYIGYMAFKNGTPIAYGGGWILFDSCRIGVNVFPAFRGGESSLIFAQIISVYKHVFNLNRFTVDPYQIGKNNSDGIRSGAFWMYYRLGFRPMQENLKALAEDESNKIAAGKSYRSPARILNKLADSKLELFTGNKTHAARFDATDLSLLSLHMQKIEPFTKTKLPAGRINENWVKIFGVTQWEKLLKDTRIKELIQLKTNGDEWTYIHQLQQHRNLQKALSGGLQNDIDI
jgi:hypothetical protein